MRRGDRLSKSFPIVKGDYRGLTLTEIARSAADETRDPCARSFRPEAPFRFVDLLEPPANPDCRAPWPRRRLAHPLLGVLPKAGRRAPDAGRRLGEAERVPEDGDGAGRRVVQVDPHVPAHARVAEDP